MIGSIMTGMLREAVAEVSGARRALGDAPAWPIRHFRPEIERRIAAKPGGRAPMLEAAE